MTKNKDAITIQGVKLYPHQKAVWDEVNAHRTDSVVVVKSSRQKGKTLLITQLLLQTALEFPNSNSVLIEPVNASCRRVMKDMVNMIDTIPIIKSANFQFLDLDFVNGSSIQFRSAESKDTLRGISLRKNSLLCLDEGAYIPDEVYGIVFPFANVHKCTKVIVSTPLFKSGKFYEHYKLAKENKLNHYLIDFNDYDTSMLFSKEQMEEARRTTSANLFLSDYLGEFLTEQGNVFGNFGSCISNNINLNNHSFYFGIDWAQNGDNDNTAISIFNSELQQVRLKYFNNKNALSTIDEIVKLIKEYNPIKITVEKNSMGKTYYDLLLSEMQKKHLNIPVKLFDTTNDSKRRIIENMTVMIQNESVQFLDDIEMKIELAGYEMQTTKGGKSITYNGKSGTKDDCIMATAICLDSMKTKTYTVR